MNHITLDAWLQRYDDVTTSCAIAKHTKKKHIISFELNIAGGSIIFYYENTRMNIFSAHCKREPKINHSPENWKLGLCVRSEVILIITRYMMNVS